MFPYTPPPKTFPGCTSPAIQQKLNADESVAVLGNPNANVKAIPVSPLSCNRRINTTQCQLMI